MGIHNKPYAQISADTNPSVRLIILAVLLTTTQSDVKLHCYTISNKNTKLVLENKNENTKSIIDMALLLLVNQF